MFGEFQHRVDEKGRVIVPAMFREELGYKFYVTKDLTQRSLKMYSMDGWKKIADKYNRLPSNNRAVQMQRRLLFSSAVECEVDKQGRITIPVKLREYADIKKEVIFAGDGDKAEIWDTANWDKYFDESPLTPEEAADIVAELEKAL